MTDQTDGWPLSDGDLLIAPGVAMPAEWQRVGETFAGGWSLVANTRDHAALAKELAAGGWTFFFLAGAVSVNGFVWSRPNQVGSMVTQLVAGAKLRGCNCLEMESVVRRSFLGVAYLQARAHPRQIQKGKLLAGRITR